MAQLQNFRALKCAVGIAVLFAAQCRAGDDAAVEKEPIQLPDDGAWVRFAGKMFRGKADPEFEFTQTYSLVGTQKEQGVVCRWVEESIAFTKPVVRVDAIKMLIPEKDLLESETPAANVVRVWAKGDRPEIHEVKYTEEAGMEGDPHFFRGRDLLILPGVQAKAREHKDARVVENKKGRFELASRRDGKARAEYVIKKPKVGGIRTRTWSCDFSSWPCRDIPFGIASWSVKMTSPADREMRFEYVVEDFGTGARSAYPDHN
jgi:hypothetical protein